MNDPKLQHALRDHYGAQSLDPAVVARLKDAARPRRRLFVWSGVAAALLIGAGVLFLTSGKPALADTIAREVARNHKKDLAPDHEVAFPALCDAMEKLEFDLCDPADFLDGSRTAGGRYCSIQGRPAAQLKVIDGNGRQYTIYQCKDDPAFDGIADGTERVIDGVTVRMRRENGLLICLAFTGP